MCLAVTSGGTPSRRQSGRYYAASGHPWVKTKELHDQRITTTEECITDYGLAESSAKLLPENTVLVAMYGATVGMLGVLDMPAACNQACAALIVDSTRADHRFVFYSLLAHRRELQSLAVGSAQQNLSGRAVKGFPIPVPPLAEQNAIADVLGALDDKIESNGRAADLLESIVRLEHQRAVTSAITWEPLAALGSVAGGGTPSSKVPEYWDPAEVPWITPRDMTALDGSPVVWAGERSISFAGLAASSARLLEAGTVLYTSRATLGLVAIAQQPLATNQGFISITPMRPFSSAFVYATLRARTEHINAKANGSTFQEVNKTNFKTVRFARPSDDVLREFDEIATPALRQVACLVREASVLRRIRDALLPKLVSGQIRVPLSDDVEEQMGAAIEALA